MRPPYERSDPGIPAVIPDYNRVITEIMPAVSHSLREAGFVNIKHAVTESGLIAYLIGRGYAYNQAIRIVEYWECNESFPM